MPKDFENTPLEPARIKAERKWNNHFVEKSFKEARAKATESTAKEDKPPAMAEVIRNNYPKAGKIVRAQTKFANEIREMLNEHKRNNNKLLLQYLYAVRAKKIRIRELEAEKLKREAQQEN